MNLWQEPSDTTDTGSGPQCVDISFRLDCATLPVDNANALANAVLAEATWLNEIPEAGIHPLIVAGSQNGWERPQNTEGACLVLSRRTRLRIRVPAQQVERTCKALSDKTLDIDGHPMTIRRGMPRSLAVAPALFARHVHYRAHPHAAADETLFVDLILDSCNTVGYHPTKLLCGRYQEISVDNGTLATRSVMLADVPPDVSLRLQDLPFGDFALLGCGLLQPHKDIAAVG